MRILTFDEHRVALASSTGASGSQSEAGGGQLLWIVRPSNGSWQQTYVW